MSARTPDGSPKQDRSLTDRIAELERRVAQLESASAPDHASPPRATPIAPPAPSTPAQVPTPDATPDEGLTSVERLRNTKARWAESEHAPDPSPTTKASELDRAFQAEGAPAAANAASVARTKQPISLEQFIGGKSFLVMGAVIVVAAVGFFLKLAWDSGWLAMSPAWRCVTAGLFGFALVGTGEFVRAKLGRFASVGFVAAGLGTLYATAFATHAMFGLVGPGAAFGMLVGVCALGLFLSLRGRSVLLSILALLGGYSAPVILNPPDSPAWSLPMYLLALLVVGSLVAVRRPRHRGLATVTWWGTALLGTGWIIWRGDEAPWLAVGFITAVWGIVHATRARTPHPIRALRRAGAFPALSSFSSTTWAVLGGLFIAEETGILPNWSITAGFAIATIGLGWVLGNGRAVLLERPRTGRGQIGMALVAQGAALVALTVTLAIDQPWGEAVVWTLLAVGAFYAAWRIQALSVAWYGLALMVLATGRLAGMQLLEDELTRGTLTPIGLVFTPWMALVGGAAFAWFSCAVFAHKSLKLRESAAWVALRGLGCGAGSVLLGGMILHRLAEPEGLLLGWFVLTVAALLVAWRRGLVWFAGASSGYLLLAMLAWLTMSFYPDGWFGGREHTLFFMHPGLLWSIPIGVAWWALGALLKKAAWEEVEGAHFGAWGVGGLVLLLSTTLEVARFADSLTTDPTLKAGAVSLWWAIVAVGLLVFGFVRRVAPVRYAGIGLMLAATGKAVTYDLAELSPAVRIGSFLVLGLVLLTVAAVYLRTAKISTTPGSDDGDETV